MQIEWIALSDFRSYAALSYTPSSTLNVVTGSNGQGKTNLLEALGLLLVGRSFRGAKALELARWNAPRGTVSGELKRVDATRAIRIILQKVVDAIVSASSEARIREQVEMAGVSA